MRPSKKEAGLFVREKKLMATWRGITEFTLTNCDAPFLLKSKEEPIERLTANVPDVGASAVVVCARQFNLEKDCEVENATDMFVAAKLPATSSPNRNFAPPVIPDAKHAA